MQKSLKKSFFKMNHTDQLQNSTSLTNGKADSQSCDHKETTVSCDQEATMSCDQDAVSHVGTNGEVADAVKETEDGSDVSAKLTSAEKLASFAFKTTS